MIIQWVAQQEDFLFEEISFDSVQLVLGYAIIVSFIFSFSRWKFRPVLFTLIGLVLFSGYIVLQQYQSLNKEKLVLLHQTRNSILLHQRGNKLTVIAKKWPQNPSIITDYAIGERIQTVQKDTLLNSYTMESKQLFIVDSTGFYPNLKSVDFVLLSHSPKIHLERLIDSLHPKILIADGSNYKSYVERWKITCKKRKLPFHYTGEKGAFYFPIRD